MLVRQIIATQYFHQATSAVTWLMLNAPWLDISLRVRAIWYAMADRYECHGKVEL
jgi:hypothetical protein